MIAAREQYNLAYRMLRSDLWDTRTFNISCVACGIENQSIRIAALRSYSQSKITDEIGESYRNLAAQTNLDNKGIVS